MYQFTTTTIVNSNLDSSGIARFTGTADAFNVTRVNNFKKEGIVSVYKRPFQEGVLEQARVTVPVVAAGLVIRIELDIRLYGETFSDYTNVHMYFKKSEYVEVISTGVAITDATALKKQLNDLKDRFGHRYVVCDNLTNTANITITATDVAQQIFDVKLTKEVENPNSITQPAYATLANSFTLVTQGKAGFGDDNWMARKIMLPTAENVRYFGYNKEERPILGGQYTQYTLRYNIEKDGQDGTVGGGRSITTHVFYVLDQLVDEFEAAIDAVTADVTVPETPVSTIIHIDQDLN